MALLSCYSGLGAAPMPIRREPHRVWQEGGKQRTPEQRLAVAMLQGALHDLTARPRQQSSGETTICYAAYLRQTARHIWDAAAYLTGQNGNAELVMAALGLDPEAVAYHLQQELKDGIKQAQQIEQELLPAALRKNAKEKQ